MAVLARISPDKLSKAARAPATSALSNAFCTAAPPTAARYPGATATVNH
ncbi:hypothetical protein [Pseudomonas synxantha]|uniref:Uncharacterized protein n=1 Tax=Pseudomonas synxantha TaxID=47883 RepID=A0ABS0UIT5_9PSED|nr:hypothetical protein [Pseudomonas synxantha]MBI6565516.1 hypothetical protein [Pseudomonas synxantha]MBI6582891.1 hypothetical protein [Pseudomonas synxantha]MBI6646921.1 hypothetical protein [Pseudomonas synxantha]MDQ0980716.1 hypothetical protein [Pseudomonas synxantha]